MSESFLSTAQVARLLDVTETTVKRWADDGKLACEKTAGGHRKFRVGEVVAFSNAQGMSAAGLLVLDGPQKFADRVQLALMRRDMPALAQEFAALALAGSPLPLLSYLYQHQIAPVHIYDQIVREGLKEIGIQWAAGKLAVNEEHIASQATAVALAQLQTMVHKREPHGGRAVCASLGIDQHEIGIRCVGYMLEQEGWSVVQIGANISSEEIILALWRVKPQLVCLSWTAHVDADGRAAERAADAIAALRAISNAAHAMGARVMVGGAGAVRAADALEGIADHIVNSTEELQKHVHYSRN